MSNETYDLLEEAAQIQLRNVISEKEKDENGGNSKNIKSPKIDLVELLITADKNNMDYCDKQDRLKVEKEKNDDMTEMERNKQKLTWGKVGLELCKVLLPTCVSIAAYDVFQKRILKFEETGRIVSTAGRELHLPKFFKWFDDWFQKYE